MRASAGRRHPAVAYKPFTGRKIKESRLEVLRTGSCSACAKKDYTTIKVVP